LDGSSKHNISSISIYFALRTAFSISSGFFLFLPHKLYSHLVRNVSLKASCAPQTAFPHPSWLLFRNFICGNVGEIFQIPSWFCVMLLWAFNDLVHDKAVLNEDFSVNIFDLVIFKVMIVELCLSFFEFKGQKWGLAQTWGGVWAITRS